MTNILISSLACYILGVLLCKSRIFSPARWIFRSVVGNIPGLRWALTLQTDLPCPLILDEDIEGYPAPTTGYDFISCRLCTGFYIVLGWMLCVSGFDLSASDIPTFLAVYGLSYFMAKLEQP